MNPALQGGAEVEHRAPLNATQALLIANRKSGRAQLERVHACVAKMREHGFLVTEHLTDTPAEIPDQIRAHAEHCNLVVLCGGDGTANTAAPALLDTKLPFAVLPFGTANDLARTLQLPENPIEACEAILHGRRHRIDLGRVNDHYFFNVAHIGLGEKVSRELKDGDKKRWGMFSYARGVLRVIRNYRAFRATIICDGQKTRLRSIQITVGNGRFYGGGVPVTAEARIDDERLDLYSLQPQPLWQLAALAPWIRLGRHTELDEVPTLSGRRIEVRTSRRLRIDTDGEITGYTPAVFEVLPKALETIVPLDYEPPQPDKS